MKPVARSMKSQLRLSPWRKSILNRERSRAHDKWAAKMDARMQEIFGQRPAETPKESIN
jgi:hypothetical protein